MSLATRVALPAVIAEWYEALDPLPLAEALPVPAQAGIFSSDMVVGFCDTGNLASERVDALTGRVVDLFRRAHDHGVRSLVLLQDSHDQDALEFATFPPHCVRGTDEAQTIPELRALPFAADLTVLEKNTLSPALGSGLDDWLDDHPELRTAIVVGDCTDLCVYQLAMHLRLRANRGRVEGFRVIVPADAVDTYDLPAETARAMGGVAHDGDFFHRVFLYHLALCGVEIVQSLT